MQTTINHLPLHDTESGLANVDARFNQPNAGALLLTGFALGVIGTTVLFVALFCFFGH